MRSICNLHIAGGGNQFIADLAQLYAAALGDLGFDVAVKVDEPPTGARDVIDVIVAPHEYLAIGAHFTDPERRRIAQRSVMLTTEQPTSRWWSEQLRWVELSPLVMDISPMGTAELNRSGVPALRAPIGYHPILDAWEGSDTAERDIDVCFLGGTTPRRKAILGTVAPVLSHRRSRLLFHDPRVPVTSSSRWYVAGREKAELLARSRILVNVHRDEVPYFEWMRAIEAISNGALLLTEPSECSEPLEPMVHMVTSEGDLLAAHVTALLADEPLRSKIARDAYDFVRSELQMVDLLAVDIVGALRSVADTNQALGEVAPAGSVAQQERAVGDAELTALVAEARAGLDEKAADPVPGPPDPMEIPESNEYRTMAGLKRALLAQIKLEQKLQRMTQESAGVDPTAFEWRTTPAWEAATPEISVVLPLYNYERTVLEALESVLASRNVDLEVLVVEDASSDGSRPLIERFIEEHPEAPVAGLFRAANQGLSNARNLGISQARSDTCFLLDADNAVYPDALWKLRDEMDATGAAMAYCIIEVFEGPPDLVSALPWSARSLALGPYIDAMAMLRRQAWEAVGGFPPDDGALYGWEDYAFWLALANAGFEGAWVPEPLARYRRHPGSRTGVTALDLVTPFNVLRHEYRNLPW